MNAQREHSDAGFSLLELLISLTMLLVMAGAILSLYSTNLRRYSAEQQTTEMNQTARNTLGLMCVEIQQAGAHSDVNTTLTAAVNGSSTAQTITIASTVNIYAGDWVTIDPGASNEETLKVTAVGSNTLTGKVTQNHNANVLVCLYARPYKNGVLNSLGPQQLGHEQLHQILRRHQ